MSTTRIHQRFTLQAVERLKLRKQIETLFQTGEAFSVFPLRVVYQYLPERGEAEPSPVRIGFSIPKKRLRKAVQRNRVRRLLKEAWRLQKHALYAQVPATAQLHCFFIYTGNDQFTFPDAEKVVKKVMGRLLRIVSPAPESGQGETAAGANA